MKYVGWVGAMVVTSLLVAIPARAEVLPCAIGSTGVTCPPPTMCNDDAQCFGQGLGRCLRTGSGGGSGICSTDCNSIFGCTGTSDCPTFDPLVASCQTLSGGGGSGICTYHDASDRPFVTLCSFTTAAQARVCFVGGSWDQGDCDQDGVLNGVDANPCSASVRGTVAAVPSPFCLGGHVCEGTSSTCAPFLRCSNGTDCANVELRIGTLNPWECTALPGAMAVTFCHPSCNATVHCAGTLDCSVLGACRAVDSALSMCVPSALSSCAASCAGNPLDWATGQGDCDGDGAQNGCDPRPCVAGDPPCLSNHMCSVDAGVLIPDASVSTGDAALAGDAGPDASIPRSDAAQTTDATLADGGDIAIDGDTRLDAGRARDGGNLAMDASAGPDAATGLGFGGGGGCRCALVGGPATSRVPASLVAALVALVLAQRRRRRPADVTRR